MRSRSRSRRAGRALLALGAAVLFSLVAVPAAEARPYKAFWGSLDSTDPDLPTLERLGVDLYQVSLRWDQAAPTRPANPADPRDPAYTWPARFDEVLQQTRARGMRVLVMIAATPRWANGGRTSAWAPTRPADLGAFAEAVSRRFPAVRHWMVYGEPNRKANFKPLTPQTIGKPLTRAQSRAPRTYARMLDAAYGGLKRARRSNVVIGGNTFTAGEIRPVRWAQNMRLPNGRPPRLDVYGHNPFCLRAPNLANPPGPQEISDFSDLRRFGKVVDRHFGRRPGKRPRHIPLFLSEWTVPTGPDREFSFYATMAAQKRFIERGFRIARQLRVYGLGWIHLRDEPPPPGGGRRSHAGLIRFDGVEKPGFDAFRRGKL